MTMDGGATVMLLCSVAKLGCARAAGVRDNDVLVAIDGVRVSEKVRAQTTASYLRRDLQGIDMSAAGAVFDRSNRIEEFRVTATPKWTSSCSTKNRCVFCAGATSFA